MREAHFAWCQWRRQRVDKLFAPGVEARGGAGCGEQDFLTQGSRVGGDGALHRCIDHQQVGRESRGRERNQRRDFCRADELMRAVAGERGE